MRIKYPRTPHLPWSPGASDDDIHSTTPNMFDNKQVVVTEKMDGENTTLYRNYMHARSLDSRFHPSRTWVQGLQANIGYQIPENWRICGENLYAQHSIAYQQLADFFLAFSVWNERNECLSWRDTQQFLAKLGLQTPTVLYEGLWNESKIKQLKINPEKQEGYVIRLAGSFHFDDFEKSIAKWVRKNHVVTDQHWMHSAVIPNKLKSDNNE